MCVLCWKVGLDVVVHIHVTGFTRLGCVFWERDRRTFRPSLQSCLLVPFSNLVCFLLLHQVYERCKPVCLGTASGTGSRWDRSQAEGAGKSQGATRNLIDHVGAAQPSTCSMRQNSRESGRPDITVQQHRNTPCHREAEIGCGQAAVQFLCWRWRDVSEAHTRIA